VALLSQPPGHLDRLVMRWQFGAHLPPWLLGGGLFEFVVDQGLVLEVLLSRRLLVVAIGSRDARVLPFPVIWIPPVENPQAIGMARRD